MLRGAHSVVGWSECAEIEARALEVFGGFARDPSSHDHEMHALHREWLDSLDRALGKFARSRGRDFDAVLADVRAARDRGDETAAGLLGAVADATDYASWARDMRRSAALATYVLGVGGGPDPERGYANLRRRAGSGSSSDDSREEG